MMKIQDRKLVYKLVANDPAKTISEIIDSVAIQAIGNSFHTLTIHFHNLKHPVLETVTLSHSFVVGLEPHYRFFVESYDCPNWRDDPNWFRVYFALENLLDGENYPSVYLPVGRDRFLVSLICYDYSEWEETAENEIIKLEKGGK